MEKNSIQIKQTAENCTVLVRQALASVKSGFENVIEFEKGRYFFHKDGCFVGDFFPSNNASGEKNVVFPILDKSDLVIDGNGSEFVFCDRIFPFILQNAKNVTLRNFDIDFSFPRHCQGVVRSSDEEGFALEIDKATFDYYVENGNLKFNIGTYVAGTDKKKLFIKDVNNARVPVAFLFAGDSADSKENLPARFLETDAEEIDGGVYFRYREGSKTVVYPVGDTIFIGNDENRENDVIFAELCENITLQNVNIYRGAGMGFIAQLCTNITVDGVQIRPKAGRDTLLSTTADALHFINCDGKVVIRNSRIEKSIDDALNIHGVYTIAKRILSPTEVEIGFGHEEQSGFVPYLAGDTVAVNNMAEGTEKGSAVVSAVTHNEDRSHIVVHFTTDISSLIQEGDALENTSRSAEFIFDNNIVLHCPHIRVSSKKMTIQNSLLSMQYADLYINDLFDYWYESGSVEDVVIRGNTFIKPRSGANIKILSSRKGEHAKQHNRIVIENNRFASPAETAISAEAVKELTVQNNQFDCK